MRVTAAGRRAAAAALLLATGVSGAARAATDDAEWPGWRGPRRDGVSRSAGVFGPRSRLEVAWSREIGSGYSGIAVAGGRAVSLFGIGDSDYVVALDAASGDELWRHRIGPTYRGREGAQDGPVSTPAIDDGRVYALGPEGALLCLAAATGELLWAAHLVEDYGAEVPHWGFAASPLVEGSRVVVESGGAQGALVLAFDKLSGAPAWSAGRDVLSYQSPAVLPLAGRRQLVAAGDETMVGLDPESGETLWSYRHGGEQFYRRILNPLLIGEDGLFVTHRPDAATLLRIASDGESFAVEEAWSTPHLRYNYAVPVAWGGSIFGYGGRFLTAVDARGGELEWKSRPPGDGMLIVVDGHLVVLTKKGSLHVAPASAEGYRQIHELQLFERTSWTPPSFAEGRIYARDSFSRIAAVAVRSDRTSAAPERVPALHLPDTRFGRWVDALAGHPDPARALDELLSARSSLPIYEGDDVVHVVYRGEAREVALRGDMFEFGDEVTMLRIPGSDGWYASFRLAPDARLSYQFVLDLDRRIADPRNPRTGPSPDPSTPVSLVLMPRSETSGGAGPPVAPLRGRLESHRIESERVELGAKTWGGERALSVYLPPGYDAGSEPVDLLVANYDETMARDIGTLQVLDEQIGASLRPAVAVFVESISPYELARSQRVLYEKMIVEQLLPWLEERYRLTRDPGRRSIVGVDEGAASALFIALRNPEVFGRAAAQSPRPIGPGREELLGLARASGAPPLTLHLDWGRYDFKQTAYDTDVRRDARDLFAALGARGHRLAGGESPDGVGRPAWRWRTRSLLAHLLGTPESSSEPAE